MFDEGISQRMFGSPFGVFCYSHIHVNSMVHMLKSIQPSTVAEVP